MNSMTLPPSARFDFPLIGSPTVNLSMLRLKRKARKGGRALSLMDLLIGTALIALFLSGVFIAGSRVSNNMTSNKHAQYLGQMVADAQSIYANQGNFNGVSPQALINLGLVPAPMVQGTDIIAEGWNTPIGVAPTNLNGTAGDGIEFSYTLPRTMCAKFVNSATQIAARIMVDGTTVKNVATGANNLDATQLQTACNSTQGGNVVVLVAQGR